MIMADLKEAMQAPPTTIGAHRHAIVFLYEMPRDPHPEEAGCDWIEGAEAHRACLRSAETAVVIANYIRLLGWDAKAHTGTSSDVDFEPSRGLRRGWCVWKTASLLRPIWAPDLVWQP